MNNIKLPAQLPALRTYLIVNNTTKQKDEVIILFIQIIKIRNILF